MDERWLAYNNAETDILSFRKDLKMRDHLSKSKICLQTLKDHGGAKTDVQMLYRLPSNNFKPAQ